MDSPAVPELSKLAERPFHSFSEAASAALAVLAEHLPGATVGVGVLNFEQGEFWVIETCGDSISECKPGARLPIGEAFCMHMVNEKAPRLCNDASADPVYGALAEFRDWSVRSYVGFPLELSDGGRVGSLFAVAPEKGGFTSDDQELIGLAGRMLAYEWERVARDVELKRLRKHRGDDDTTDPATGVTQHKTFLTWLVAEWQASYQGAVESYLVVFELGAKSADEALLGDAARVLDGEARRTDLVGRLEGDRFGVVLVGCKGRDGAIAFCKRTQAALEVAAKGRAIDISPGIDVHDLSALRSADQVLDIVGRPPTAAAQKIRAAPQAG